MIALDRAVADALERGRWRGPLARGAARLWQEIADPVRPLALPRDVHVIAVGGATLGGSGKTPVVIELARKLAPEGVAVVASGYRSRLGVARRVREDDAAELVGDEAALLARELAEDGVPVVGGRDRQRALALAAQLAPTVIVDALLQTRPASVSTSMLVLDAGRPWGSGACPPCGDLRAAPRRLLAASDVVIVVERAGAECALELDRPIVRARSEILGALRHDGRRVTTGELAALRLGLVLAVARPQRIIEDLAALGVVPGALELHADHAFPTAPARPAEGVDAWLTTGKCATKLGATFAGAPVWTLLHRVRLPR